MEMCNDDGPSTSIPSEMMASSGEIVSEDKTSPLSTNLMEISTKSKTLDCIDEMVAVACEVVDDKNACSVSSSVELLNLMLDELSGLRVSPILGKDSSSAFCVLNQSQAEAQLLDRTLSDIVDCSGLKNGDKPLACAEGLQASLNGAVEESIGSPLTIELFSEMLCGKSELDAALPLNSNSTNCHAQNQTHYGEEFFETKIGESLVDTGCEDKKNCSEARNSVESAKECQTAGICEKVEGNHPSNSPTSVDLLDQILEGKPKVDVAPSPNENSPIFHTKKRKQRRAEFLEKMKAGTLGTVGLPKQAENHKEKLKSLVCGEENQESPIDILENSNLCGSNLSVELLSLMLNEMPDLGVLPSLQNNSSISRTQKRRKRREALQEKIISNSPGNNDLTRSTNNHYNTENELLECAEGTPVSLNGAVEGNCQHGSPHCVDLLGQMLDEMAGLTVTSHEKGSSISRAQKRKQRKLKCRANKVDNSQKLQEGIDEGVFSLLAPSSSKNQRISGEWLPSYMDSVDLSPLINRPSQTKRKNKKSKCLKKEECGSDLKSSKQTPKKAEEKFEDYMEKEDIEKGLESLSLIKGNLRINPRNYKYAYISDPNERDDILILGVTDRNRAMENDVVVIQIKEQEHWHAQPNGEIQRTGKVVYICEQVHTRVCIGTLKKIDKTYALLCPLDHSIPRLQVPVTTLPLTVLQNPSAYSNTLFLGKLISWEKPQFAQGLIEKDIGEKGDIRAETEGLLLSLGLDKNPVSESFNAYFPKCPYVISEKDLNSRLDLRKTCIFSIDPETARDLDDAVSIERLGEDEYRVGVHISDVTYFLDEGTPLDAEVAKRATTIYLVQRAIHMLPVELCMLCSLLPGQDKLAFSVIWRMNSKGDILETNVTRSVINSCSQLSYQHAQAIIKGESVELPEIYNGFSETDVKKSVLMLQDIAENLRRSRYEGGALKIGEPNPKLKFFLDSESMPIDVGICELQESNWLIEEFMLLANMSVAKILIQAFPKVAFLRSHSVPKSSLLEKLEQSLHKLGIFLDISSAGQLHQSILNYASDTSRHMVLNILCAKPMNRAMYVCNKDNYHHYALNVPLYTHFTSPIRRYADIVVHRQLAAHLGYTTAPNWTSDTINRIASNCNKKKYDAKKAGDLSSDLYLALYIRTIGSKISKAVVFNVASYSFDAVLMEFGYNVRVYTENLDAKVEYTDNSLASTLVIHWNKRSGGLMQIIQVFSEVDLLLKPMSGVLNIEADLLVPQREHVTMV